MLSLAPDTANAMLDALAAKLKNGGTIKIYAGSGVLLGSLSLSKPAAQKASNSALIFNTIAEEPMALASGVATLARVSSASGVPVLDCDIGGTKEQTTGVIQLNTAEIAAGGPIRISSFILGVEG